MGQHFSEPSEANPEGYYEDIEFLRVNQIMLEGMHFKYWLKEIRDIVSRRQHPWGMKDPRSCYLIREYQCLFPDGVFIRLKRNTADVVKSMERWFNTTDTHTMVLEREILLDMALLDPITIQFEDIVSGKAKETVRQVVANLHHSG